MIEELLSQPRFRRLAMAVFLVVSSVIAGYGVYQGKMKILAILALFTGGFLLRQASIRNAYWLTVTALQLAVVRPGPIRDEFAIDRWIALAALAGLSLFIALVHASRPAWPGLTHVLAAALLTTAAASSAWSPDPPQSFAKAGSVGLVMLIAFVGLWSHADSLAAAREIADVHVDMLWLVFPGAVLAWLLDVPGMLYASRLTWIFENPNALGMWVSGGLPLLFGLALVHPVAWRRKACWFLLATGGLVGLLSGSRGGVLGAALGLGLVAGFRFSRLVLAASLAAATVGTFLMLYGVDVLSRSDTLMALVRPDTLDDLSDRRIWWDVGLLIAQQKPWLGHGFGVSESLFATYGLETAHGTFGATVHNTYLAALMELGRVGTALLVAAGAWATWTGIAAWRRDRDGERGILALALAGSAMAWMAHSFVEEKLLSAGNPWMLPFWVTLALMVRLRRQQRDEAREEAVLLQRAAQRRPWIREPAPA